MIETTLNPGQSEPGIVVSNENFIRPGLVDEREQGQSLLNIHKKVEKQSKREDVLYRKVSYFTASGLHFIAALSKLLGLGIENQKKINGFALSLSKIVHTLAYGSLAIDAFQDNRIMDAVSKALDPLMSNFSSIENINLTKGIAGGLNTLDFAQASRVPKKNGKKENLKFNLKKMVDMAKEIYSNNPFSKNRKIFVAPGKEQGHSLACAGHLILASSKSRFDI